VALGSHLFRQFNAFKNRKIRFMKALSDSLYFKNLDNNEGVFHRVVDEAREEECKEAILAYRFLLASDRGLDAAGLDQAVERWFLDKHEIAFDFEVDDGVAKLERLGLVRREGAVLRCVPLAEANRILDQRWDGYFSFA
jgi:hypothetical protein